MHWGARSPGSSTTIAQEQTPRRGLPRSNPSDPSRVDPTRPRMVPPLRAPTAGSGHEASPHLEQKREVMPLHAALRSFEALFQVPAHHRLVQVRSRSRGGLISGTFWHHEEYDRSGQLIARFESFEETGPTGDLASGWRRYDATGRFIEEGGLRQPASGGSPPGPVSESKPRG